MTSSSPSTQLGLWATYIAIACAVATGTAFFAARLVPRRVAAVFDLFPYDHWDPDGTPLVKRATQRGAACTFAFMLVGLAIAGVFVAQYFTANTVLLEALVPIATLPGALPVTTTTMTLQVWYRDGDSDACNLRAGAVAAFQGMSSSSSSFAVDYTAGVCALAWHFQAVSFGTSAQMLVTQPAWLAQQTAWSLTSDSGMTQAPSSAVSGTVAASAAQRVNGVVAVSVSATATRLVDVTGAVAKVGIVLASLDEVVPMDDASSILVGDVVQLAVNFQVRFAHAVVTAANS